jgi:hypothetical protein
MNGMHTPTRRSNSASFSSVEKQHPGMKVIFGPFAVDSVYEKVTQAEKASAVRQYRRQLEKDAGAKLVTVGKFAYVLTREAFIKADSPAEKYRADTGIRVTRRAKA